MQFSRQLLLVAFSVLLATFPIEAQTLYGSLTGTVTDASGAAVPLAKVEALNTNTGNTKSTQTDDRGLDSQERR